MVYTDKDTACTTVGTKKWAQNQLAVSEQFQTIKVWSSYRNIKLFYKRISQLAVSLSLLYFVLNNKECLGGMPSWLVASCLAASATTKYVKILGIYFVGFLQPYFGELTSCIIVLILLHFVFSKCWYLHILGAITRGLQWPRLTPWHPKIFGVIF